MPLAPSQGVVSSAISRTSTNHRGLDVRGNWPTDGAVTLTGSMNWTRDAGANSEDLNLVSSPAIAAAYAAHWSARLAVSLPFNRREDDAGVRPRQRADAPGPTPFPIAQAQGLCKLTVLVPEGCAEGIRQFARDLCQRQEAGTFHVLGSGGSSARVPS